MKLTEIIFKQYEYIKDGVTFRPISGTLLREIRSNIHELGNPIWSCNRPDRKTYVQFLIAQYKQNIILTRETRGHFFLIDYLIDSGIELGNIAFPFAALLTNTGRAFEVSTKGIVFKSKSAEFNEYTGRYWYYERNKPPNIRLSEIKKLENSLYNVQAICYLGVAGIKVDR